MTALMSQAMDRFDPATPPHLRGNNAPVDRELTVTDLEVKGAIPPELEGRYFRNGANPLTGFTVHWFLGDGMVHGIELSGGKASWYRNRWVHTPMYDSPGADRTQLAMDPETLAMDLSVSAANTHVIGYAGRIFALEEGAYPYELTPELETVGPFDFDGKLTTAMTAHPKRCPETGELLFFGYGLLPPYFTYHRASADGVLVQSEEITVGGPTMMHDFAVSRNHIVVMDLPAVFDLELAMQGGMPIRWSDDYPARMGVFPHDGGDADVTWFDIDPCYVFHTMNAHDDGDAVVVRGGRIPELWRESADMDLGEEPPPGAGPCLWEWRLDLATGTHTARQIDDQSCEFPRVADADAGLDSRYGYMMAIHAEGAAGEVVKYDLRDGSKASHVFPEGHTPGEPVFVPAEGASNPDDGYVMTFVHAADTDTSYLVILDAASPEGDPVAEVHLPTRVPSGFHGSWIADG